MESLERAFELPFVDADSIITVSIIGLVINLIGLAFFHEFSHGGGECSHGGHSHGKSHDHGSGKCSGHGDKQTKGLDSMSLT